MLNINKKRQGIEAKPDKLSKAKKIKRRQEAEAEEYRLSKLLFDDGEDLVENLGDVTDDDSLSFLDDIESDDRKPAWNDDEDENITVAKALTSQHRTLPEGGINERSNKYSDLLKEKFKTVYGTPKWASLDKNEGNESDEEILKSNKHILKTKSRNLPKSVLNIKRMKDLNKQTYSEGPIITSVDFHQSSSVSLVAGLNGVVSIYAVDGRENEKLHTLGYNRYPIHNARFSKDGEEVILGGQHSYYHCYNLMSGETRRVMLPHGITQMKIYDISPCGKFIIVAGRFGELFMLNTTSKELLCTMKQSTKCIGMAFSSDSSKLFCHGLENEITVFDMKERRVCQKFMDDGCIAGSCIDLSPNGQYLATGSAEGVVNIYETKDVMKSNGLNNSPKPIKTIMNLKTSISGVCYNPTTEILAIHSAEVDNAIRLIHFPSATVFSNFPGMNNSTDVGRPTKVAFSPASGYFAIANNRHSVALYRLKHYNNY